MTARRAGPSSPQSADPSSSCPRAPPDLSSNAPAGSSSPPRNAPGYRRRRWRRRNVVDAGRVAVAGSSQGGALALAAAGLLPGLAAALVDVPFLAGIGHALQSATEGPYLEIIRYLAMHPGDEHAALRTLSYMDGCGFAARADAPALFSVGLMDPVCPPAGVDAAFLTYRGAKTLEVYRYGGHEGGHRAHEQKQLRWLRDAFGQPRPQLPVRLPGPTAG
ncbi:acetylxylan esterase [Catellatospora aurea]|uniref:Acetylxylan esterase n=1 Tax=Catellatospora aurea TaxID=1337874 RepID=A0ABW2H008_9ACTN